MLRRIPDGVNRNGNADHSQQQQKEGRQRIDPERDRRRVQPTSRRQHHRHSLFKNAPGQPADRQTTGSRQSMGKPIGNGRPPGGDNGRQASRQEQADHQLKQKKRFHSVHHTSPENSPTAKPRPAVSKISEPTGKRTQTGFPALPVPGSFRARRPTSSAGHAR